MTNQATKGSPALYSNAGAFVAVIVLDGTRDAAAAGLKALLSLHDDRLLVGAHVSLVGVVDALADTVWRSRTGAVFVQLGATSKPARDALVSKVEDVAAANGLTVVVRALGARAKDNREAFGFNDGKAPSAADVAGAVRDDGTTAVLFMQMQQDVARFHARPIAEQHAVMGIDFDGHRLAAPSPRAHATRMGDARLPLVRRGFPLESGDGFVFVGVAREPETFIRTLALLVDDALLDFARTTSAGSFLAIPDASMVDALLGSQMPDARRDPQLVTYPQALTMLQYLMRCRELGAFVGPLGDMQLNPYLRPVVDAMHNVLAGGQVSFTITQRANPEIMRELEELLDKCRADANEINKRSGYYVTAIG